MTEQQLTQEQKPVVEPVWYGSWSEVPWMMASKTQMAKADLPREPVGPVRGYVPGRDFRDKEISIPLYSVAESVPTKASGGQLASADGRRTTTVRVCTDCGANCQQPLQPREGRHLCAMCWRIAKLVDFQIRLGERRAVLADWARERLADEALAVVWVEMQNGGRTDSGRVRPPLAARVHAVDAQGKRLVDVVVKLAGPRTEGARPDAVPAEEGVVKLRKALGGRRVLVWAADSLKPVTDRLKVLGHPLELERVPMLVTGAPWDGWQGQMKDMVAQWRGELDPASGELLSGWEPATADRLHLLLTRMASTGHPGRDGSSAQSRREAGQERTWGAYDVRVAVTGPAAAGERLADVLADEGVVDRNSVMGPVPSREVPGAAVTYMAGRAEALVEPIADSKP
ncbi:hypothetical protein [Streptomyces sp. NPDC056491]|uniref:hypothetical protein n=1 Tax=Streptomyces sp. NPDC056491 TaxID=3345837 RepID=UPI0036C5CDA6